MKNILVPCDFSKPSEEAFKFAVRIASQTDGQIHVIHIIDITFLKGDSTVSNSYVFNVNFLKDLERESEQKFHTLWEKHAPMMMPIRFRHLVSSLTLEVENYIKVNNIDLVVMGTNGEGNAIFGSNTQKVVRISPVPVIAMRTAPVVVRNIALAVSNDQFSDDFVRHVKQLQSLFHAALHLVYINTPVSFQSDTKSNLLLTELAEHAQFSRYTTSIRADYSVEAGLINFAKEINADMMAIGTHGRKGLAHLLVGSTAENIVNDLKVPIWTLSLNATG